MLLVGDGKVIGLLLEQGNIVQSLAQTHQDNAVAHDVEANTGDEIDT